MKSKRKFSFEEVCKIHFLSRELAKLQAKHASNNEQKKVRDKLRAAGFYITDCKSKGKL